MSKFFPWNAFFFGQTCVCNFIYCVHSFCCIFVILKKKVVVIWGILGIFIETFMKQDNFYKIYFQNSTIHIKKNLKKNYKWWKEHKFMDKPQQTLMMKKQPWKPQKPNIWISIWNPFFTFSTSISWAKQKNDRYSSFLN